tara:strand:- start:7772 stop:7966 length:195 start_codon:yes stop_codon:yes gene_type:complete
MAMDDIAALGMIVISGEVADNLDLVIRDREKHGIGTAGLSLAIFAMTDAAHLEVSLNRVAYRAA